MASSGVLRFNTINRIKEGIKKVEEERKYEAIKLLEEEMAINKDSAELDVVVFPYLAFAYHQLQNFSIGKIIIND